MRTYRGQIGGGLMIGSSLDWLFRIPFVIIETIVRVAILVLLNRKLAPYLKRHFPKIDEKTRHYGLLAVLAILLLWPVFVLPQPIDALGQVDPGFCTLHRLQMWGNLLNDKTGDFEMTETRCMGRYYLAQALAKNEYMACREAYPFAGVCEYQIAQKSGNAKYCEFVSTDSSSPYEDQTYSSAQCRIDLLRSQAANCSDSACRKSVADQCRTLAGSGSTEFYQYSCRRSVMAAGGDLEACALYAASQRTDCVNSIVRPGATADACAKIRDAGVRQECLDLVALYPGLCQTKRFEEQVKPGGPHVCALNQQWLCQTPPQRLVSEYFEPEVNLTAAQSCARSGAP
ncbi:Uncharacterised protein [uncultured archaeon]|nr:Uncharacterised protein [uncultured archaeon]